LSPPSSHLLPLPRQTRSEPPRSSRRSIRASVTVEEHVDRLTHPKRDPEDARDQVPRSAWKDADWYVTAGEPPYDLHHSSVTAEGEDGVVVTPALIGHFGCVTWALGEDEIALHSAMGERRLRLRLSAHASSGPGIYDE
jgi:hypothetical protein